ncbi:MAG: M16 family metallopeptidase [Phycisphaerales bacterium JB038]
MAGIVTRKLDCGATLVMEQMTGVRSAGLSWLVPAGTAAEPTDRLGLSAILGELLLRGAGDLDSRGQSEALDLLGISRHSGAQTRHIGVFMTLLGERVRSALPLLADMVRRPRLEAGQLEPVRELCLQSLMGLEDEPQEKTFVLLKEHHLQPPYNRSSYGSLAGLQTATCDDVRRFHRARFRPEGCIIGIAGHIDPEAITDQCNELLADWEGTAAEPPRGASADRGLHHVTDESAQVHIGLMLDAPREVEEESMLERVAVAALGGGMSSRLFTEVREKRSLCYAVHASYAPGRDEGRTVCYAGTSPDRAQETLDVLVAELQRLGQGIGEDEFHRAVTGLKSRIIMHGESTAARASALASETFVRGQARTLTELAERVDGVRYEHVNAYLADRGLGEPTIVTIGPAPLTSPL